MIVAQIVCKVTLSCWNHYRNKNCGHVKAQVYGNKPRTIEEPKEEICRVIGELDPEMCQQVIANFVIRQKLASKAEVDMPDLIFHT